MLLYERLPGISPDDDSRVQRDSPEELQPKLLGGALPAAPLEHVDGLPTVRADEPAHVLHDTDDREPHGLGKRDALPHIEKRYLLRGCHDDRSVRVRDFLRDAERFVARPGREVDDHEVQVPPVHVDHHLLDRFDLQRAPPDYGRIAAHEELGH